MGTREDIVEACTRLIAEEGMDALSLRKVAERVGIRAPSIYQHFASKELLLDAARHTALQALAGAMAASRSGRTARQRLLSTALGYMDFAREQPHFFALLFMQTTSDRTSLEQAPDADSPYLLLVAHVREFLGGNAANAEHLAFGIWSLLHGAAVLRHTHLKRFTGPIDEATRSSLGALLDGWTAP